MGNWALLTMYGRHYYLHETKAGLQYWAASTWKDEGRNNMTIDRVAELSSSHRVVRLPGDPRIPDELKVAEYL